MYGITWYDCDTRVAQTGFVYETSVAALRAAARGLQRGEFSGGLSLLLQVDIDRLVPGTDEGWPITEAHVERLNRDDEDCAVIARMRRREPMPAA